jgi:peptidyl-prolyl cis-trans isomerase C
MKNIKIFIAILSAISALVLSSGCAKKPSLDDKVLVKVSDSIITVKDFKSRIAKLPPYYRNIVEKDSKRYLEEIIMEKLFYEAAIRKGLDRDKEVVEIVNQAKKKIITAKLIETEVDANVKITKDEMKQYYETHKGDFKTPELWRASHILIATEKEARDILDALAQGAKFEDLAKEKSMDATATRGGDIGFFRLGQLVPDFEKACLKLSIGQTSDVVKTQFGYHIIKLTDKKEAGAEDFDKAKGKIENVLKKQKRVELFNNMVMGLKNKYGVEVNEDVLNEIDGGGREGQPGGAK